MLDRNPSFRLEGCDVKEKWAVMGISRRIFAFFEGKVDEAAKKSCFAVLFCASLVANLGAKVRRALTLTLGVATYLIQLRSVFGG